MKIDLEFVELHSPLFIDGMNFGLKLYADPKKSKAPISMYYDTDLKHTIIMYKQKVSMVQSTASMTISFPNQIGILPTEKPHEVMPVAPQYEDRIVRAQVSGPSMQTLKQTAQVSDPTKQPPKTITRKAKFQGEESQGE